MSTASVKQQLVNNNTPRRPNTEYSPAKPHLIPDNPTNGSVLYLNFEIHRLFTFPLYHPKFSTKELAASGFFLTVEKRFIQCYFCETKILLNINIQDKELSTLHKPDCTIIDPDADNDNVPIQDTTYYKYEAYRLNTFVGIPWKSPVSQYLLAKDGFYWTGSEDNCRCAFCRLEVRGWEPGDTPSGEHQRWNSGCQYHQNKECGNVSIGDEIRNIPQSADDQAAIAECLSNPFATNWKKIILENTVIYNPHIKKHLPVDELGVTFLTPAKYPDFITMNKRIDSYKLWPISLPQKPQDLTEAGFYYTGVGDRVICFQCGGGLKDWSENDKPWIEHAKWFPACSYLHIKKGKTFIEALNQCHSKTSRTEVDSVEKKVAEPTSKELSKTFTPDPNKLNQVVVDSPEKFRKGITDKETDNVSCRDCTEKDITIVNLPCGHMEYCENCIQKDKINCSRCSKEINAYIHTFLA